MATVDTNAVATSLRSILAGQQFDRKTLSSFLQADPQAQAQIIENLANSPTPAELAGVEAALQPEQVVAAPKEFLTGITAEAHWWGYRITIPENVMKEIVQAPNLLKTVTGLLTPVLAGGALAVVLGIVIGYIVAEVALMKAVDKGRGVKLTAVWLAPFILVPSSL